MGKGNEWEVASTLGETIYRMVHQGKTKTPEFEKLLEFYGREKLLKLYFEVKDRKELE